MTSWQEKSPDHFLKHYWQKRPLLIRGAFPGFQDPVTPDELAGLACEKDVESRLVMERGGKKAWQVTLGPQRASTLRQLPSSHWTLLVQGVDRLLPEVAAMLDSFRFIPDWRVDDVMISFAPRGGTVGPHIDSYDVFLIQGQGCRRWRLDSNAPKELRQGLDLRILKKFHADQDWVLEPGDMLYLPPNLAHYGVALENCLTYSIGFRSPGAMELLVSAQDRLMRENAPDVRYRDAGLKRTNVPGEISRAAIQDLRQLLEGALNRLGPRDFDSLVGEFLTEPKGSSSEGVLLSSAALRAKLKKGFVLMRSAASRMVFIRQEKSVVLFVDGRSFPLNAALAFAAPLLSGKKRLSISDLSPHWNNKNFFSLLISLIQTGAFRWSVRDDHGRL